MITHDLLENITNYIFVLLLMCTSLLVKLGDAGTLLLDRAATLSRSAGVIIRLKKQRYPADE